MVAVVQGSFASEGFGLRFGALTCFCRGGSTSRRTYQARQAMAGNSTSRLDGRVPPFSLLYVCVHLLGCSFHVVNGKPFDLLLFLFGIGRVLTEVTARQPVVLI